MRYFTKRMIRMLFIFLLAITQNLDELSKIQNTPLRMEDKNENIQKKINN